MRIPRFRFRQGQVPVAHALIGARELADPVGVDRGGDVGSTPTHLDPHEPARCDIWLSDSGLTIVPSSDGWADLPTLVSWSQLRGFRAEDSVLLPNGMASQVLDIVVADGVFAGGVDTRRFIASAPDLAVFFRGVTVWSERWASEVHGGAAGPAATVGRVGAVGWIGGVGRLGFPGLVSARLHRSHGHGHSRWHGARGGRWRGAPAVAGLVVLITIAGGATATLGSAAPAAPRHQHDVRYHFYERGNTSSLAVAPAVTNLPVATAAPEPAPPSLVGSPPLQSHEVFGYAPYWTLAQSGGFNVHDLTTLAYFSVEANGNGTLDQSGPGWNGYQSQDLANLITRSHAAGDRVVLTVSCFDQATLNQITSDPHAASRLSSALIAALWAKNLDGVNFDFEGKGSADRQGLTTLITQVSAALHAANSHWQVTMATYATSASDPSGFYDVAALAPAVDAFFVMAYDMNDPATPGATAPLTGGGFNDADALRAYSAVVPAQKIILGVPYYGYDWPTTNGTLAATATGSESPIGYGTVAASGNPTYWDPATQTAWTSYQVGSQWHETFFDNPTSLALKAQLANSFHIRGMGIWALGMDGNDPAMLLALLGNAPVAKGFTLGPTTTSSSGSGAGSGVNGSGSSGSSSLGSTISQGTSGPAPSGSGSLGPAAPAGTGYSTSGVWQGAQQALTPVTSVPTSSRGSQVLGVLTGLQTDDPFLTCLQGGPSPLVESFASNPGVDYVVASQPQDCADAVWTFSVPPAGGSIASATPTTTSPSTAGNATTATTTTSTSGTSTSPAG